MLAVFPQALVAFPDLGTISACAFLVRWSGAEQAQRLRRAEIEAFLCTHRQGQPRASADRIYAAMQADALVAPVHLARARTSAIALTAAQVRLMQRQRATWEKPLR